MESFELDNLEKLWIIVLNARNQQYGYNIKGGGHNGEPWNKGKKGLQAGWLKGKKHPRAAEWMKGRKVSEDTRKKLSKSFKGRKAWNKGTKGLCKPNSGSFNKDTPTCFKKGHRVPFEQSSKAGILGAHVTWHINRGITSPDCQYCARG